MSTLSHTAKRTGDRSSVRDEKVLKHCGKIKSNGHVFAKPNVSKNIDYVKILPKAHLASDATRRQLLSKCDSGRMYRNSFSGRFILTLLPVKTDASLKSMRGEEVALTFSRAHVMLRKIATWCDKSQEMFCHLASVLTPN